MQFEDQVGYFTIHSLSEHPFRCEDGNVSAISCIIASSKSVSISAGIIMLPRVRDFCLTSSNTRKHIPRDFPGSRQ